MSLTPSTMMDLGTPAPDFSLTDVCTGETVSLSSIQTDQALLVIFMCAHCPYVVLIEHEFAAISRDYQNKGLQIIGISANDADNYPADAPEQLKEQAERVGFNFPYLYDDNQSVAKAYQAACTPDLYLFDADHKLVYRGQLDDARPGNDIPTDGKNLRAAIDSTLAGQPVTESQQPATGCNIKWKPGNKPSYFG